MKSKFLKIFPSILTIIGTFLLGHNLLGTSIDESVWGEISGAALALVGIVISIKEHSATVEMIQAGLRRAIEVVGTLLVSSGRVTNETLQMILSVVVVVVPVIYGFFSKQKTQKLARGELSTDDLKK